MLGNEIGARKVVRAHFPISRPGALSAVQHATARPKGRPLGPRAALPSSASALSSFRGSLQAAGQPRRGVGTRPLPLQLAAGPAAASGVFSSGVWLLCGAARLACGLPGAAVGWQLVVGSGLLSQAGSPGLRLPHSAHQGRLLHVSRTQGRSGAVWQARSGPCSWPFLAVPSTGSGRNGQERA